jgi:serine/threonine protein kinase
MIGDRLGQYRILQRIGAGGMGEVYRARDEKLERDVAVKVLPRDLRVDDDRLRRFVNEARAASALNHPHILTIYDIGESGGVPFIAMELVDGVTLRERLRGGPVAHHAAFSSARTADSSRSKVNQSPFITTERLRCRGTW